MGIYARIANSYPPNYLESYVYRQFTLRADGLGADWNQQQKRCLMLHNRFARPTTGSAPDVSDPSRSIHLAEPGSRPAAPQTVNLDVVAIVSRRCSAFFAEAAVLVLVFGILDYLMLKGRIEFEWIVGAFAISVFLLAVSILMDLTAHRWIKAHP